MYVRMLNELVKASTRPVAPLMAQRFSKAVREADAMMSRARVYSDVNVHNSKDYWDYETLSIQWGYASMSLFSGLE